MTRQDKPVQTHPTRSALASHLLCYCCCCHTLLAARPPAAPPPAAGFHQPDPSRSGLLLACASKAATHSPLLLPPTAALAAALESRGNHTSAAAALRYCLALLQTASQRGPQGLAAVGLSAGFSGDLDQTSTTHQLLLVQPSGFAESALGQVEVLEGYGGVQVVSTALELALARNLCLAGEYEESLGLYQKLEGEGALAAAAAAGSSSSSSGSSASWLCYGAAAQAVGQDGLCERAMTAALEAAADGRVQLAAVTALLQVGFWAWSGSGLSCVLRAVGCEPAFTCQNILHSCGSHCTRRRLCNDV